MCHGHADWADVSLTFSNRRFFFYIFLYFCSFPDLLEDKTVCAASTLLRDSCGENFRFSYFEGQLLPLLPPSAFDLFSGQNSVGDLLYGPVNILLHVCV
jgi:hypothetical protein